MDDRRLRRVMGVGGDMLWKRKHEKARGETAGSFFLPLFIFSHSYFQPAIV
jgi:hypothetical protein